MFFGVPVFAQKMAFYKTLKSKAFNVYAPNHELLNSDLDILNFDLNVVTSKFYSAVNTHKYRRSKLPLQQDSIYNKICEVGINVFNRSIYTGYSWDRKKKYFYKALIKLKSHYRFYQAFVFKVRLVNYKGGAYYYNRSDGGSVLNLVYGSKKQNKIKEDKGLPLNYILPISELEMMDIILRKLISSIGKRNFGSNFYSQIGFAIKLNPKSINRRALPEAYVMVMMGGKVMQKLRL